MPINLNVPGESPPITNGMSPVPNVDQLSGQATGNLTVVTGKLNETRAKVNELVAVVNTLITAMRELGLIRSQ